MKAMFLRFAALCVISAACQAQSTDGEPVPAPSKPAVVPKEDQSWLTEFPEALNYEKIGEENIAGRTA